MKKTILILIAFFANISLNAQEVIPLSQGRNVKVSNPSPIYRPIGPSIRLSVGVPGLITAAYNHQITPWFMIGAGSGFGMGYYTYHYYVPEYYRNDYIGTSLVESREDDSFISGYVIPIYAEAELRTPKYKWSAFLNIKIGADIGVSPSSKTSRHLYIYTYDYQGNTVFAETTTKLNPFFISSAIGFGYKKFSMGYGIGFQGGHRFGNLFLSYTIPMKKLAN